MARVDLGGSDEYDAYLAESIPRESERSPTAAACYMEYLLAPGEDRLRLNNLACRDLRQVIALDEIGGKYGVPRVVIGTVSADIESLRMHFNTECGVATYRTDGPTLPYKSSRRAFLLPLHGCEWDRAEALKGGRVVARAFKGTYED